MDLLRSFKICRITEALEPPEKSKIMQDMMKIAALRKVITQRNDDPMNEVVLHQLFSEDDYNKLMQTMTYKNQKIEKF